MSKNLDIAKKIIKANYKDFDGGLFDSRNIVGDDMRTIYDKGGLTIDVCDFYEYIEIFGLDYKDFRKLDKYYDGLVKKYRKKKYGKDKTKKKKQKPFFMNWENDKLRCTNKNFERFYNLLNNHNLLTDSRYATEYLDHSLTLTLNLNIDQIANFGIKFYGGK